MKKILVIGSLNMDFVAGVSHIPTVGETILAENFELVPGGKGANQSYAIGKMHGNVAMLGMVGQDTYGERLCENLESVGVDVSRVRKLSGVSTGIAVIGVIPEGDNSILVVSGANAHVDKSYIMENMDLLEASDIIVVQLEIPLETVMYAVKEARKRGKTVILDPAPAVSDLPDELFACVDVIKPNETELAILLQECSDEEDLRANAKLLQQKGAKNIVLLLRPKNPLAPKRLPNLPHSCLPQLWYLPHGLSYQHAVFFPYGLLSEDKSLRLRSQAHPLQSRYP